MTTCYILGSRIEAGEGGNRTEWDGRVTIIPVAYNTFIRRAEKRMLGLREKLKDAPFLKAHGLDADTFVDPQPDLLGPAGAGSSAQP